MSYYRFRRVVLIPPSTDKTIIFPYNFYSRQFVTQHYFPGMTNNKVSSEEIDQFLEEIETQLAAYHRASGQKLLRFLSCFWFVMIIAFIVVVITSIAGLTSSKGSFPVAIPVIAAIFFGYFICFFIIAMVCRARGNAKLREVTLNVQLYIAERTPQYKPRGLTWVMPVHFPYWIELWKDDSVNMNMQQPPNYYSILPMQSPPSTGYFINSASHPSEGFNAPNGAHYARPGQSVSMMQPIQMQIQPQTQQGGYMQGQYGNNMYA